MTEAQLKGKNKDYVVMYAVGLQNELQSATAGALTASGLERKVLDLKRKVISVRDNALQREQEYNTDVARIKSDTEIRLKELELEYSTTDDAEGKELSELFKSLEFQASKAEKDLTFGLKEAETTANEALVKIKERVEKAELESEKTIIELANSVIEETSKSIGESMKLKTNHSRDMEALKYENSIAIRNESLKTAEVIAQKYDATLIDDMELKALTEFKAMEEEKLAELIGDVKDVTKTEVHRSEGAKLSALKSTSENTIALLENDKANLEQNNAELKARIATLESQVINIPIQMKEALGAANTEIVNNIDAAKK